jgi:FkbM family methyltransferase
VRLSQSKIGPVVCPRPVTVEVDLQSLGRHVYLRSHTTDISVLGEVLVARAHDQLASTIGDAGMIVDLGSNTGLTARWFMERFPRARLVAVEPQRGNLETLRRNLRPYGGRATVIGAAVGGRERRVAITTSHGEFGFKIVDLAGDADGDTEVITMETVLAGATGIIDLLKCDIEGAESELFESCSDWLPRVRYASVECHHPFTQADLVRLLRANGCEPGILFAESTPQFGCDSVVLRIRPAESQRASENQQSP